MADAKNYGQSGLSSTVEFGKDGPLVKDNAGIFELKDNTDTSLIRLKTADPQDDQDVVTKKFLETRSHVSVTGQIDGSSPPGSATAGAVYIVTTAGGSYSLNELYRWDGSAWEQLTVFEGMRITITDNLTGGTDTYNGDHIYLWDADGSDWVDVGPTQEISNVERNIKATLAYTDSGDNNIGSAVPAGAVVNKFLINVTQAFTDNSATLKIGDASDDDRFVETKEVKLKTVGLYVADCFYEYGTSTQIIANLVPGTSTAGQVTILGIYSKA